MAPRSTPLLYLTCGFPPEQVGGVEQHALELGRALRGAGLDVAFYTRGERPDLAEGNTYHQEHDGFSVTRVVYRWSVARDLKYIYDDETLGVTFARFLARARPRLVHVHHLSGLGASCLKVVRASGIPLVMTLHDYWLMCPRGQMFHAELRPCAAVEPGLCAPCIAATWPTLVPSGGGLPVEGSPPRDDRAAIAALHRWLREILALPDRLLTPSVAARERFLAFGVPPERIQVVENGLDAAPYRELRREPSPRVRFGFVGALLPSKGAHVLLQAFAGLPPGTASLLIAGNAPPFHQHTRYLEDVRALAARVPPGNPVEILGAYDHRDLPRLLARIDVLVVPPLWHEVFGLTLREGMLAGCAAVAARTGGLPQAIREGENGFTYPPADGAALAGILRRFVDDRGLAARLGAGPRRIRTIEEMADELLGIYAQLGLDLP